MAVHYKLGKVTPVNYLAIDKTTAFNSSTAITAVISVDDIPGKVMFTEPKPIYRTYYNGKRNPQKKVIVGYEDGHLEIPSHPIQSGRWLNYVVGTCATTSAYLHTITESDTTLYGLQIHTELEHVSASSLNNSLDLLGSTVESYTLTFGQADPAQHAMSIRVAEPQAGGDIARPTGLDSKGYFRAGMFSNVLAYDSTSGGVQVLGGDITIRNTVKYYKGGAEYATTRVLNSRDYDINLDVIVFNNTLLASIPHNDASYATALTYAFKTWRNSTSDYISLSFNSLHLDRPDAMKIDDKQWIFRDRWHFTSGGASATTLGIKVVDDASGGKYETA